jgi:teichuronic acid exporter
MELDILPAILPVLALRILFDAIATVPAPLVARRMQFRYTALRSLLANGVAAGALRLAGAGGLRALGAGPVADRQRLRRDGGLGPGRALAAGAGRLRTALRDLGFFGLYAMGGRILNQARLDQLLLGVVMGAATLGLYYFAQRLFTMLGD